MPEPTHAVLVNVIHQPSTKRFYLIPFNITEEQGMWARIHEEQKGFDTEFQAAAYVAVHGIVLGKNPKWPGAVYAQTLPHGVPV